nr:MAG TPA: nucelotide kinase [Caudoviricetes sp.]
MTDAKETVHDPGWYTSGAVETIAKIEAVIDGLPAREAFLLGQVIRYADRAGEKDDPAVDLGKANNYAFRLVTGDWRSDGGR